MRERRENEREERQSIVALVINSPSEMTHSSDLSHSPVLCFSDLSTAKLK